MNCLISEEKRKQALNVTMEQPAMFTNNTFQRKREEEQKQNVGTTLTRIIITIWMQQINVKMN